MKNKPITLVLIVAVVLIWAWIMYSVFDYMQSPEVAIMASKPKRTTVAKEDTLITDYVLALNYKDPFLKKEYSNNGRNVQSVSQNETMQLTTANSALKKTPSVVIDKVEVPLPVIKYVGRIQNAKSNKPVAIVVINDREYMMQEGEVKDGVTLSQIKPDSMKVMCSKKIFYVKKQ